MIGFLCFKGYETPKSIANWAYVSGMVGLKFLAFASLVLLVSIELLTLFLNRVETEQIWLKTVIRLGSFEKTEY